MVGVAEGSEKYRDSAFAKFSSRSFFSFKTVRWKLMSAISLDKSSEECHCQINCQPKQLLFSADVTTEITCYIIVVVIIMVVMGVDILG